MITKRTIKRISLAFFILLLLGLGWYFYTQSIFRVISTSPAQNSFPTSAVAIEITLSDDIESVGRISVTPSVNLPDPVIKDTNLSLRVVDLFEEGGEYTINISSITSKSGEEISNYSYTFTPQYIDPVDLDERQQRLQVDASNSFQIDDPFLIDNAFPIITDEYMIEAQNDQNDTITVTVKFLDEIPNFDKGGRVTQLDDTTAEEYRRLALQTIRDKGGNPDEYSIFYSNNYLNEKYIVDPHN